MMVLIGGTLLVAASLFYLAVKLRVAYGVGAEPENAGGVPLDGPHHLAEIVRGAKFKDGEKLTERAA